MAKPGVTMTKDDVDAILKQIRTLTKQEVLIGVPDEEAGRYEDEKGAKALKKAKAAQKARKAGEDAPYKATEGISNAEIGYVQEFGLPEKNIPARPFLIPGVESAGDRLAGTLKAGAIKALKGDGEAVELALGKAGLTAQNAVRNKITDGPFAPLSERTLDERKRRGRTGEKPLIDSGQLRNSVTYVIRPRGK